MDCFDLLYVSICTISIPGGSDNEGDGWMGEGTRVESDVALSSLVGLGLKGVTFIEPPPIPSYGLRG